MSEYHKWSSNFPEASPRNQDSRPSSVSQGDPKPEGKSETSTATSIGREQSQNPTHALPRLLPPSQSSEALISQAQSPSSQLGASSSTSSNIGRPGRRSKSHTSNACNNCKRAHLGCDVQRPCSRCVSSGKQDTCADVPQKKRGRPRLRGESSSASAALREDVFPQVAIEEEAESSQQLQPPHPDSGHRRTDSMRSMLSTETSSVASASTSSPVSMRDPSDSFSRFLGGVPNQRRMLVPTAWLDLDLNFLKADNDFSRIFGDRQIGPGRRLPDVANSVKPDVFHILRTQMRDEREAKDPAYLPPILSPGEDPLGPMDAVNMAEATRGFDTIHYQLSYTFASGTVQTLSTKFNLARTSRYFIVMSLPPISPDFFAVIVHQANRAREPEANTGPGAVGAQSVMSMFSDPRVASVLSPTTSSPTDSPIDLLDSDIPPFASSNSIANRQDLYQPVRWPAEFPPPRHETSVPMIRLPQPPPLGQQESARSEAVSDEYQSKPLTYPISIAPSPASTAFSSSELDISRTPSREAPAGPEDEQTSQLLSGPLSTLSTKQDTPQPSATPVQSTQSSTPTGSGNVPTRKASQQGSHRDEEKRRRMDIGSLLHR